jgi:long-chain acyl-CoA synthetase
MQRPPAPHPRQQAQFIAAMPSTAAAAALDEANIESLAALFVARCQRTPQGIACRSFDRRANTWRTLSWAALEARVAALADALATLALPTGARVALMLDNGPDWVAAEQAIYRLGLVSVGIYVQDTPGNAAHVLDNAGAAALFVRDAALFAPVAREAALPALRQVVVLHGAAGEDARSIAVADFLARAQARATVAAPGRGELASLVYTSGTTGAAKGAMLTHGALLANVFACERAFDSGSDVVKLCILPLSHSFERVAGWHHAVLTGATTVFCRGPEHLADDLLEQRPTVLLGVPRLYERLYARLTQAIMQGPLHHRALFHLAVSELGQRFSRRLTARLIAGVQQRFGGRLRMAISGGAPLSPEIARAFTALGIPLLQGYGLTEAGPVVSVHRPPAAGVVAEPLPPDAESAGTPLDNVETRIAPDGELLVRSPSRMLGYWQDAEATARVLDEAGWLHTGDKASRLAGADLVLTGRIKDVLVTSTGVKACPAAIESRLTAEPLFEQALVLGESRPYLVALLVAEPTELAALQRTLALEDSGAAPGDARGQSREQSLEQSLERALLERCRLRLAGLPQSHQLRRVALVDAFTLANGLVTTTLKPRRAVIARLHAPLIESLYAGHCHTYKSDCASNAESRRE